jgi:hypothetical protein
MIQQSTDIRSFLRAGERSSGFDFCLPFFGASLASPAPLSGAAGESFGYPSSTFAERDARSALHVMHAVSAASSDEEIEFTPPRKFMERPAGTRTAFVFGSRSNEAAQWLLNLVDEPGLVSFEFGDSWAIIGADGRRFSIPDPSQLDRESYAALTDYGVVARLSPPGRNGAVFLIAGLGGRATEGCGLFLSRKWSDLQAKFGSRDFATILQFSPPVSPEQYTQIASYS